MMQMCSMRLLNHACKLKSDICMMLKHSLGSDVLNIVFKNTLQVISSNCVWGDSNR